MNIDCTCPHQDAHEPRENHGRTCPVRSEPQPDDSGPANPGFCCTSCGAGFDFGCNCPDY